MANQFVCVLAETYGLRIFAIMLPSSYFSVAYWKGLHNFYIRNIFTMVLQQLF